MHVVAKVPIFIPHCENVFCTAGPIKELFLFSKDTGHSHFRRCRSSRTCLHQCLLQSEDYLTKLNPHSFRTSLP